MFRFIAIGMVVLLITACGDPRQTMLPENLEQWKSDKKFLSSIEKLTSEEKKMLSTYLMRVTLEQINGESIPKGMTIADAIEEQKIFVDGWLEEQEEKKAEARAIIKFKEDYQDQQVDVLDFEVREKRSKSGSQVYKVACGSIVNKGSKPLCDLEVTIYFLDKYGYNISERVYTPIKSLTAMKVDGETYVFEPNKKINFNYPIVENIPPNWNGMARAKITDITFLEDSPGSEN